MQKQMENMRISVASRPIFVRRLKWKSQSHTTSAMHYIDFLICLTKNNKTNNIICVEKWERKKDKNVQEIFNFGLDNSVVTLPHLKPLTFYICRWREIDQMNQRLKPIVWPNFILFFNRIFTELSWAHIKCEKNAKKVFEFINLWDFIFCWKCWSKQIAHSYIHECLLSISKKCLSEKE